VQAERRAAAELDRAVAAEARERLRAGEAQAAAVEAGQERDRARRAEVTARSEAERALKAELRTVAEAETTQAVRDFLLGLFERMNSSTPGARKLTAYELLEQGRKQVATQLADKPVLRSAVLQSLAKIYDNIGDLDNARSLYQEAADLERLPRTGRPPVLALMLARRALADSNDGKHAAAEAPARESLALRINHVGANSLEAADSHAILGLVLTGLRRPQEAREHLEKSLSIRLALQGEKSEEVATAAHNLGQHYALTGATDKGVREYQRAIDIKTALFGAAHPKTLNSVEGLGLTLWRANRLAEAEPLLSRLYHAQVDINGPRAERVASAADAWANVLFDLGRFSEARMRFQEAVNILGAVPAEQRQLRFAFYSHNLALLMEEQGDYAGAADMFRDSLAVRERHLDETNPGLLRARMAAARLYLKHGRFADAETLMQKTLKARERIARPGESEVFDSRLGLIELALAMQGAEAAQAALQALDVPADLPAQRKTAHQRLRARIELALGQPALALVQAEERVESLRKSSGANHPRTLIAALERAELLARFGRLEEARVLVVPLAPVLRAELPDHSAHLARLAQLESRITPPTAAAR
jgi:serine/threonine-protein kinase